MIGAARTTMADLGDGLPPAVSGSCRFAGHGSRSQSMTCTQRDAVLTSYVCPHE